MQAGREIVPPVVLPSNGHDLALCLQTIRDGFSQIHAALAEKPVAISFAFPGPADYASGVIGDLANLPAFRGGVPLGPMFEEKFRLPVFINNDGDLFAYGEAIAGLLPQTNAEAGRRRRRETLQEPVGRHAGHRLRGRHRPRRPTLPGRQRGGAPKSGTCAASSIRVAPSRRT